MTKTEALYKFFSSFGMPAYPSDSVPNDAIFPWLTYENKIGESMGEAVEITVTLWYHTESEAPPNNKADEIYNRIGMGGVTLPYDNGMIWIKRSTTWSYSLHDENDTTIKGRALSLSLEFI